MSFLSVALLCANFQSSFSLAELAVKLEEHYKRPVFIGVSKVQNKVTGITFPAKLDDLNDELKKNMLRLVPGDALMITDEELSHQEMLGISLPPVDIDFDIKDGKVAAKSTKDPGFGVVEVAKMGWRKKVNLPWFLNGSLITISAKTMLEDDFVRSVALSHGCYARQTPEEWTFTMTPDEFRRRLIKTIERSKNPAIVSRKDYFLAAINSLPNSALTKAMATKGDIQEIKLAPNAPVIRAGLATLKKLMGANADKLDRLSFDKTRQMKLQYQTPLSFRLSIPVFDSENPTDKSEIIVQ
ncbi:MAG: hypothetical protein JST35_02885 [Armatimonadetes bacterium]|nr:hypothetical protein [Armatimonadota bacterium]